MKTGDKMKEKLSILAIALVLFATSCKKEPIAHVKIDKTPYETRECTKELSLGNEINYDALIDKIIVYKKDRKLYTYHKGKLVEEFRISLGKNGDKGDKLAMGDYKTPEGSYNIIRKKCDSRLYKSLMISYPNKADKEMAEQMGVNPGGYITIHGQPKWNASGEGDEYTLSNDWTEGCIAITNKAMDKLWMAVKNGVIIEIYS